jgi:RNA recognition motif-containing protein
LADFFQIELVPKENKMSVKLYVGNLAYTTTEEELRTLFTQAGAVTSVALIKDRFTGDSKGFAFVEMESQADAQKAITQFDGSKLGDRDLKVNLARPREERGGFGGGGGGSYNRGGGGGGGGRGNDRNRGGPRRY